MTADDAEQLIRSYLDAFNARDSEAMLAVLAEDVVHDINQGGREIGRQKFRWFNAKMAQHYDEQLGDIVVMVSADGNRAAAEFTVRGTYRKTAEGLPAANGQGYSISAGIFFEIDDGLISRVTTFYNLAEWIRQVEAAGACVTLRTLTGAALDAALGDLARLRITVFREWPYLYEGDLDYERTYLSKFAASKGAVIIAARDGDRLVGAATAAPLADHFDDFAEPFEKNGLKAEDFFYFGESVLLPDYRGQGIGVRFFDEREKAARDEGFERIVFCGVIRPDDHPLRPAHYVPLDGFWRNRGYEKMDGVTCDFPWRDIGDDHETRKPMQFWTRTLPKG